MRIVLILAFFFGISTPAFAEWREAKTRHFDVYSEGSEFSLREFAIKVERFDTHLRSYFKVSDEDQPQKLTIFMLRTAADVAEFVGKGGKNVAGVYIPRGKGSFAVVHRETEKWEGGLGATEVLFHEYGHHFMSHYFPKAYPAWYVEGFAEYLSTTDFTKEGKAKVGIPAYHRAFGLLQEKAIPSEKLMANRSWDFSDEQRDAYYGRSWLLVHYLSFAPERTGQLGKYLTEINTGKSGLDAAKLVFGDLAKLDKDLAAYLKKPKMMSLQLGRITPLPTDITISILSPGSSAIIRQRMALMRSDDEEDLKPIIVELKKAAAKHPGEATVWRWLAEAESANDNDKGALEAIDKALQITPDMSRALLLKGQITIRELIRGNVIAADKWKAARALIIKANRADTNDPMPLYAYYNSWKQQGIPPANVSLDGLARAFEMVPEDDKVRFTYAMALANKKDFDWAIRLLQPVAFSPHENEQSVRARKMIDDLKEARDAKTPVTFEASDN